MDSSDRSSQAGYRERVASYWDTHKWEEVPPYWAGFAPVQEYLAARAGNRAQHYHNSILARHCAGRVFGNGISLACGLGRAERTFAGLGMAGRITGIDLSPLSIERARAEAVKAGYGDRLQYVVADVQQWLAQDGVAAIDLVIAVGGLHHLVDPFDLLRTLRRKMTADGILFVDEYVGPDYYQYDAKTLDVINDLLSALHPLAPSHWAPHWNGFSKEEFLAGDPSEGVAASKILPAIRESFTIVEQFSLCGTLLLPLFGFMHNAMTQDASCRAAMVEMATVLLEFERQLVEAGRLDPHFVCLVAKPKRL
ncbi:MAG: class I SAM-dependent methyltransferase [Thermoguttaceae bacterium]|jgi:SAM-dependent methyltransferase